MREPDCTKLEPAAEDSNSLRFTEIPRTTRLFNDFLYDFKKVEPFYPSYGRETSPLAEHARRVGEQQFERERVAAALEKTNRTVGSPDLTFRNIELLSRPGSVAVVTGQQAGLFTGPLYTIHKALTVVKLAACLREQNVDAVPVFWVASEDHDYEEVNHCKVIDLDGRLTEIRYEACGHTEDIPVGRVGLCPEIAAKIDEFLSHLPKSEFIAEIEKDLRESYEPGVNFSEAFAKLLARLFKDYGVILLDPLEEGLKQVAAPLYSQSLEKSDEIAKGLIDASARLERAGYHAQIHVSDDMVPLFMIDENRRVALTQQDGRFLLKGSERSFAREELIALARACPGCFSPNVALRPVVQDYLLPTAAYIGGPSEIAYFAQVREVYRALGRQEPCVIPRASLTMVEHRHQKTMKKYSLQLSDFFEGLHAAVTKVVEQSLDQGTADTFSRAEKAIMDEFDALEASLRKADPTLANSSKRTRAKLVYQIEHLRTRFVHASAHREQTAFRQVERACNTLFPDKNLQERELNLYYFLARYGSNLLSELYDAAAVGYSNHALLNIGGVASQVVNSR